MRAKVSSKSLKLAKLWLCGLRVSKQNLTYAHFCGSMPGVPLTSFPLGSLSGIVQWRRYASTFISLRKNAWYLRYTLTGERETTFTTSHHYSSSNPSIHQS
jgi:hypothetical protein